MIFRATSALLVAAGIAAAQQGAIDDAIRKQAAEISRLMRESERLLLEITRVDRLVETQKQVEEELKKLLPPEQGGTGAAGGEEGAQKREQLEQQHREIGQRLEEMLAGEREKANLAVQQLEELLKKLPRQQQAQSSGGQGDQKSEEREKRLKDRQEEERKQHQPQTGQQQPPRDPKDKQQRSDKRPPPEDPAAARLRRVEAWIARLPPEDQERINRNDFSRIPMRYRRLVEEYTAQRAKRDADR